MRCMHYLILVSLHMAHLKLLCNILVNIGACCENVSGHGERKFALHKIVFQL